MTEWYTSIVAGIKSALDAVYVSKVDRSHISYGVVDGTSTATAFTATVPGLTTLVDGATVMLKNGVVTSAAGFTIDVNGLGAKPVYSNMAAATAESTMFNVNYTMLFVYDSTRVEDGCWILYRGYNANDNTIGYQIRTNNSVFTAADKGYRYRIWLQTTDGKLMPVNTSTSTNATANRSTAMNTRKFVLDGKIVYNSTKADYQANDALPTGSMWQQYNLTLGYSFNNSGAALTLTSGSPVYMVCTDEGDGLGQLTSPYYTQTLPNSADNKLYVFLGMATAATTVELALEHPIFEYKNGAIGLWSNNGHTHTKSQITDFPTIPSSSSDLSDGSSLVKTSNTSGLLKNDGSVMTSGTGSTNWATGDHTHSGYISTSSTAGLVKNDGSIMTSGTGSTNYAAGDHTHSGMLTTSDIYDGLDSTSTTKALSAKQGKELNTLIGNAITYINQ